MKNLETPELKKDCELIMANLAPYVEKIGIFGSVKHKPVGEIKDIDYVVFVDIDKFLLVKQIIGKLKLSYPIVVSSLNGGYIKGNYCDNKPLYYHFTVLEKAAPIWTL